MPVSKYELASKLESVAAQAEAQRDENASLRAEVDQYRSGQSGQPQEAVDPEVDRRIDDALSRLDAVFASA